MKPRSRARGRAGRTAFLDGREPLRQRGRRAHAGKWISPIRQRDAPVRDRAARVFREHGVEALDRGAELERMQQRDGAIEVRARLRRAAVLEIHGAELFRRRSGGVLLVLLGVQHRGQREGGGQQDGQTMGHGAILFGGMTRHHSAAGGGARLRRGCGAGVARLRCRCFGRFNRNTGTAVEPKHRHCG